MSSFSVTFQSEQQIELLLLNGELDAHTASDLEAAIRQCIDANKLHILIEGSNLQYISSAGLGVFMAFIEEIREKGGDIKIAGLQPRVFNVFDLLGFPVLFDIEKTKDEAVAKFSAGSRGEKIPKI